MLLSYLRRIVDDPDVANGTWWPFADPTIARAFVALAEAVEAWAMGSVLNDGRDKRSGQLVFCLDQLRHALAAKEPTDAH